MSVFCKESSITIIETATPVRVVRNRHFLRRSDFPQLEDRSHSHFPGLGTLGFIVILMAALFLCFSPAYGAVTYSEVAAESEKTDLPVCLWQDKAEEASAVVLMLHGFSQRAFTLRKTAQSLASRGAIVYGLDLRGHGAWHDNRRIAEDGARSDYCASQKDAEKLIKLLKDEYPDKPLFVIGESMGAAVALRASSNTPGMVNGLVLCGAGCKCGRANLAWVFTDMVKAAFRRPVNVLRYQLKYGTEDLIGFQETTADPLQRRTFRLREILRARSFLKKNHKFAENLDPGMSVLVIQGGEDRVLTCKSAQKVFDAIPSRDKSFVTVPNCGHILLGTTRPKNLVVGSIVSFIEHCMPATVASDRNANQLMSSSQAHPL